MAKQHAPRFLKLVQAAKKEIAETTVEVVRQRLDAGESLTLIDVREESEFARGHIPGAIHLGKGVIERDIEKTVPDPTSPLVLYCGGGYRSALATKALKDMGYENVLSMDGGWRGWNAAGFPVESPNDPPN